ncbi:tetraacyldisaccharide 4'-kinase [Motilimonas pumila]|uniref:Tetraacyldisaccharide 4'-kinase n=1 Tax=Motilimonas pumila TaxID=2303987 RepID=A0A418YC17_9GAMM|nr:tetraacyldisaccharide 4'-kinase [Motilimonas pumila]RJG42005.1 tetraacyldisaccharide 4'-kinase [Motilimonas pumila]
MQFWYQDSWLRLLLLPLSALFALLAGLRKKLFELGLKNRYRADVPVIVVGNLTVGGNGKTPVVIHLCEQLTQAGFKPGVVSRGYGGKADHYPYVLTENSQTEQAGDEPVLIFQRTGCPVVVDPIRSRAAQALTTQFDVDVIIADDGLQHYALARDIEIVVVDSERQFGNQCRLPAGPLREPLSRLRSVDYVILNGSTTQLPAWTSLVNTTPFTMTLAPQLPRRVDGGDGQLLPQSINACAAIGHPPRFFDSLRQLGFQLNQVQAFADHHQYQAQDLALFKSDTPLLMTEKDAVKCLTFSQPHYWFLPVSATLDRDMIEPIVTQLRQRQ